MVLLGVDIQVALIAVVRGQPQLHFTLNRQWVFAPSQGYALRLTGQGVRYLADRWPLVRLTALALAVLPGCSACPSWPSSWPPRVMAVFSFLLLRTWVFRPRPPAAGADEPTASSPSSCRASTRRTTSGRSTSGCAPTLVRGRRGATRSSSASIRAPTPPRSASASSARRTTAVKMLRLSRRFGQPAATMAGLRMASRRRVRGHRLRPAGPARADRRDDPALARGLRRRLRPAALARGRDPGQAHRWPRSGYRVIRRVAEVEIPPNTGDFRLMSRRVVDEVLRLNETHGFLRGMVALVGFRQTSVLYDRDPRAGGHQQVQPLLRVACASGSTASSASRATRCSSSRCIGLFFSAVAMMLGAGLRAAAGLLGGHPLRQPDAGHDHLLLQRAAAAEPRGDGRVRRPHLRRGQAPAGVHRRRGRG